MVELGDEFGFQTEDDGTYEVRGLQAGTWQVGFFDREGDYLSEYYDNQPTSETATTWSCLRAVPGAASTPDSTTRLTFAAR